MLDLSFAAQSSALGAQVPISTLGKVVWRTSSAPARCGADIARIAEKIAKLVRIIVSPGSNAFSRHRYCGAAERTRARDCARRRPHQASERQKMVSGSAARRHCLQSVERA